MRNKRGRNRQAKEQAEEKPVGVIKEMAGDLLDMPFNMEISGNTEAVIEGCTGILQYDETAIKLGTSRFVVSFTGRNLLIQSMVSGGAIVKGFITGIEFNV